MKKQKRWASLRKRMAATHFLRRGLALFLDFIFIGLFSLPLYAALYYFLSLSHPEYKSPVEDIKKVFSLKTDDKTISPLGELLLEKTEKEIKKRIDKAEKVLKEKELSSEEKKKLELVIKKGEEKLEIIHRQRQQADSAEKAKQELPNELVSSSEFFMKFEEKFKWIQEILVAYIYFTLFFYFNGRTLGKRIIGLRVVKPDGSKLSFWAAFERTHGYAYSTSLLLIGFFQVLWDKRGLTMHDKIAETKVIRFQRIKKRKKPKLKKKTKDT